MKVTFVDVDRNTLYLLPPSIQEWLPEQHLARFVVEIVEQSNLQSLNASKHKALSYGHACKLEKQLEAEVAELLQKAESVDNADILDGMDIPAELSIRQKRVNAIKEAKAEIEQRAAERHTEEQKVYETKGAERTKKELETGKKARSKTPQPATSGPTEKDQVNLNDKESRIMPTSGGGFEHAYNVQAGVDTETMLIVTTHVTQAPNDKKEIEPARANLKQLPKEIGTVTDILADNGYFSRIPDP